MLSAHLLYGKRIWARKLHSTEIQLVDIVLTAESFIILFLAGIIVYCICYISHSLKATNSDLGIAILRASHMPPFN